MMKGAQHVLWSSAWASPWANAPGYIFAVIMLGGVLLAGLQYLQENLARGAGSKVQQAAQQRRKIALVAASAIVAIGFGGAIGPEAGLLAVVAECAAIVSDQLAAAYAQTRRMNRWGEGAAQPASRRRCTAGAAASRCECRYGCRYGCRCGCKPCPAAVAERAGGCVWHGGFLWNQQAADRQPVSATALARLRVIRSRGRCVPGFAGGAGRRAAGLAVCVAASQSARLAANHSPPLASHSGGYGDFCRIGCGLSAAAFFGAPRVGACAGARHPC